MGSNEYGQLGLGADNAAQQLFALLLKADDSVLSWGSNWYGQIGNGECYGDSGCAGSNQVRSTPCALDLP